MPDEAAFLKAAQHVPPDDPARLGYADWLEDRGDERAEYIRLEAQMSAWSPSSDAFAAARPKRNELRLAIAKDWLRAMGYGRARPLFTKLPSFREERWRLVEEFIDTWYGSSTTRTGCTEAELQSAETRLSRRLPSAIREFYGRFGKRLSPWNHQDAYPTLAR